jgi:hypothetical protein
MSVAVASAVPESAPAMSQVFSSPFLGKPISLLTKANVRHEGKLYTVVARFPLTAHQPFFKYFQFTLLQQTERWPGCFRSMREQRRRGTDRKAMGERVKGLASWQGGARQRLLTCHAMPSASIHINAQAFAMLPQRHIARSFDRVQGYDVGAESVWVHQQMTVLWRGHQPEGEHKRQHEAQRCDRR